MKEQFEKFLNDNFIRFTLRVSIKIYNNGECDKNRFTYCIGKLSDEYIKKIMDFLSGNESAKKYILRRTNDKSSFIVTIDSQSVRFYLDFGFIKNKISMISVEIKDDLWNMKTYTPKDIDDFPEKFLPLQYNLNFDSYLERSDGQKYLRFLSQPDFSLFLDYCDDEDFFENVGEPKWFQFSDNSFTFYFNSL